jgi:hypothetical protein
VTFEFEDGPPIPGVRCMRCNRETVTYDGNYYCVAPTCTWALPDREGRAPRREKEWLAVAYTLLLQSRGDEPSAEVVRNILR